ncbi:MAG: hypothetical protein JKP98_01660 [Rhodobacteraceae bacterium]|jgi:hypothetical protein|nr:hypothetical protein [Paracoccaceae bacterium]MBL4556376.1 hypothetical protein [Paracoccaceae bacterium]HBG98188.1 hypothetical protein [Paracoccaceae bacterium]
MRHLPAFLCLLGLLAGCAPPAERCANRVERQIAALDDAILGGEAALARGTRWVNQQIYTTQYQPCSTGKTGFCRTVGSIDVPVERPVDGSVERARLAGLRAERQALLARRDADLAACAAPARR